MSGYSKRNNLMIPSFGIYNGTNTTGLHTDRVGATIVVSTTKSWKGNSSFFLSAGTSGPLNIYNLPANAALFYNIASVSYTGSCFISRDDGGVINPADVGSMAIYTVDVSGAIANPKLIQDAKLGWYRIYGTYNGYSGLTGLNLFGFTFQGGLIGHGVYVDAWQVEASPFATPWESIYIGDRQHNKWKSK